MQIHVYLGPKEIFYSTDKEYLNAEILFDGISLVILTPAACSCNCHIKCCKRATANEPVISFFF